MGSLRLDELPFYPHNKSNVFGLVSYNVFERDNYNNFYLDLYMLVKH